MTREKIRRMWRRSASLAADPRRGTRVNLSTIEISSGACAPVRQPPTFTPRPLGSSRPSLALAADLRVAPPSRDDGHAPSSLLGLGRDCGAIIRSIQVVSALVDDHRPGELDLVAAGTRGQQILLQHPASAVLRAREDQRSVLA